MEWVVETVLLRDVRKLTSAIEEKDTTIALLNDDLKNREHDNVALQAQSDVYKEQLQKRQEIITYLKKTSCSSCKRSRKRQHYYDY